MKNTMIKKREYFLLKSLLFLTTFTSVALFIYLHLSNEKEVTLTTSPITQTTIRPTTKIKRHQKSRLLNDLQSNRAIKNKHFIVNSLLNTLNNTNSTNGSNSDDLFLVILIQVHSRTSNLKALIESLRYTKHINESLVIFSHDLNVTDINDLVENIEFCSTLQIFYPYSIQNYPDQFPGKDPNDCPTKISKEKAIELKCNNANHHDTYKNYRNHEIVQIKHHWFWKLSFVFEHLEVTRDLDSLVVLLLEEDHYLLPDSIHVLRKLNKKILSDVDIVSLAIFEDTDSVTTRQKQRSSIPNDTRLFNYNKALFSSTRLNTGLTFGIEQWEKIKKCTREFCRYDDYNWDFTLQKLSHKCFKLPLVSIYPSVSRVIHIGECGMHYKSKQCDPTEKVKLLKDYYEKYSQYFFSDEFKLELVNGANPGSGMPNGGWSDPRDVHLCESFPRKKFINIFDIFKPLNISTVHNFTNLLI